MITNVYTIFDSKAQCYNNPFYMINDAIALRTVQGMKDGDSDIARNPQDFTLWHMGSYDDSNGVFELRSTPKVIAKCHELFQEK